MLSGVDFKVGAFVLLLGLSAFFANLPNFDAPRTAPPTKGIADAAATPIPVISPSLRARSKSLADIAC